MGMMSFLGPLKKMITPMRKFLLPSNIGFQFCFLETQQRMQSLCSFAPVIQNKTGLWNSLLTNNCQSNTLINHQQVRTELTLLDLHRRGPKVRRKKTKPLDGNPQMKGVVIKVLKKKPKKPNSANRRCVVVRLSNGKEKTAYVPGIGSNLTEHNIVLVRVGRLQDVPGVKLKVIRGKYDCSHVVKTTK